jgi:hypothetical protein
MCTVSWVHQPDGYHLLCNRDEKRTRGKALAPRVAERGGVRYIAPVDSDGDGTWLSANEFGLSVCLLTGGAGSEQSGTRPSRGLLLRELAWAASGPECALWLGQRLVASGNDHGNAHGRRSPPGREWLFPEQQRVNAPTPAGAPNRKP